MDDGHDRESVAAYVRFATDSGLALTSNSNGSYAAEWAPHADALAPLIAAGQVQIGNHTFSPPTCASATRRRSPQSWRATRPGSRGHPPL